MTFKNKEEIEMRPSSRRFGEIRKLSLPFGGTIVIGQSSLALYSKGQGFNISSIYSKIITIGMKPIDLENPSSRDFGKEVEKEQTGWTPGEVVCTSVSG